MALIEFFAGTTGSNPGVARFAHLGGMVTGYLYIRWWWEVKIKVQSWLKRDPDEAPVRPARRTAAKAAGSASSASEQERAEALMAEVDRILDKILASGLDSLTEQERAIMRKYSDKKV